MTEGSKKVRKHYGIVQTGGNKGKLKKGYKYTGKRLKNGLAEIKKVKAKNTKKQIIGGKKNTKTTKKLSKNPPKLKQPSKKTKKLKKNSKKNMIGGDVQAFLNNLREDSDNIEKIGSGAFGIVYLDKTQPDSVFKLSKKKLTCQDWGREAEIYEEIAKFELDTRLCKMVKMEEFLINEDMCAMQLTRAHNPLGEDKYYTIQPLFGNETRYVKHEERGEFLGIKELIEKNIFTPENLPEYIADLGILMARLHYKAKNTGYDLELFISKIGNQITIYLGDLDLTRFWETNEKYTNENNSLKRRNLVIKDLVKSLEVAPYFPDYYALKDTEYAELYTIFENNYIQEAEKYDMDAMAKDVLIEYRGPEPWKPPSN